MTDKGSTFRALRRAVVKPLEWLMIVGMTVLVIDVLWGVFSRYALGSQGAFTEELAIYLLIWISLLGGALVFGEKGHLGVDYFVKKMDPAAQTIAAVVVELVALVFSVYALLIGGWSLASSALASGDTSPAMGWPLGYVYAAVPLSGVFFTFFAIEHLLEIFSGTYFTDEHEEELPAAE